MERCGGGVEQHLQPAKNSGADNGRLLQDGERGLIMGALSNVPFLAGYTEQGQLNRAQEAQGLQTLSQLMQMQKGGMEVSALRDKIAQDKQQRDLLNTFASQLPPEQQAEFRVDPKGFMDARRSENEIKAFQASQQPQLKQNLSGFEQLPATQPGASYAGDPGMVGNAEKLIQDVVTRQDISPEEKKAVINQIMQQQKSGGQTQASPVGLLSRNPIVNKATQFQIANQEKRDARADNQQFIQTVIQPFRSGERVAGQEFKSGERVAGQEFKSGERVAGQEFKAGQTANKSDAAASKVEQKAVTAAGNDKLSYQQIKSDTDNLRKEIARLKSHPGLSAMTGWQGYFPSAPETAVTSGDAKAAETLLEEIVGKTKTIGRQLATAHGKLGNMAVQEWKIVADSLANLDPKSKDFPNQLENLVNEAEGLERRTRERYTTVHEGLIDKNPKLDLDNAPPGNPPSAPNQAQNAGGSHMSDWVSRAKKMNPGMSGAAIEAEYHKKFRR
jgi:polyhydroxyalkanoate synthesis regulator phasin